MGDETKKRQRRESLKKYIYSFVVIAAAIVLFFILKNLAAIVGAIKTVLSVLSPVVYGFVFAYILNPVMTFFDGLLSKLFLKKMKKTELASKLARGLSVFFTMVLAIAIVFFLGYMMLPELYNSIAGLVVTLPDEVTAFSEKLSAAVNDYIGSDALVVGVSDYINNWIQTDLASLVNTWAAEVASGVIVAVGVVTNICVGFIICIYFLNGKERFIAGIKKIICAFVKKERVVNKIFDTARHSHRVFGGFLSGKLLDSLIIGVLNFIVMLIFGLPYPLLISVIVGVTNIIPFFGPFIGAVPSTLLILLQDPFQALIFVIIIIVIQQLDGNIIGPKIIGNSTGLSSFWVIVAITVGGGLFGMVGMIIGVPAFAVIYDIVAGIINDRLKKRKLPQQTDFYEDLEHIGEEAQTAPTGE